MNTAKIFMSGRSQALRLPKKFRFDDDEVYIQKLGDITFLVPKSAQWQTFLNGINGFSDDFMADGRFSFPTEREEI